MKQHRRYEIRFHDRTVAVFIDGAFSHSISFAEALNYQRDIVRKLLASFHRCGFAGDVTEDGALVYEGYS